MSLLREFEKHGAFFHGVNHEAKYYHGVVHKDLIVHTSRVNSEKGEKNHILEETRPNETDDLKDYRATADKQITGAAFREFLSKCNRLIRQSKISKASISKTLLEWMGSKPFSYNHKSMGYEDYLLDVVLRKALGSSPNDLLVAFPVNINDPDKPPVEMELNVVPDVVPMIVPFKNLREGNGHLMFTVGDVEIKMGKSTAKEPLYFGADAEWWYRFYPEYVAKSGGGFELTYTMEEWFYHGTGESLVNILPGETAESQDGTIAYQESHIKSYFDFAHLEMAAQSDDFIVRERFSYPLTEVLAVDCESCQGSGYIGSKREGKTCQSCQGSGKMVWAGPGNTFVRDPDDSPIDSDGKSPDRVKFYNPDLAYAKRSFEVPVELRKQGKQSIGLDLLDGTGNESGVAKDLRLETLQDKLSKIASSLFECGDRFLYQVECLLVADEGSRERPTTMIPHKLSIKDLTTLKEEAESALPEDRVFAHRSYYEIKYQNDELMLRMMKLLLDYSPLFVIPNDEINVYLAKNKISGNDLVRKLWSPKAIEYVASKNDILKMTDEKIFEKMDEYLESQDLFEEEVEEIEIVNQGSAAGAAVETNFEGGEGEGEEGTAAPSTERSTEEKVDDVVDLYLSGTLSLTKAVSQLEGLTNLPSNEIRRILASG